MISAMIEMIKLMVAMVIYLLSVGESYLVLNWALFTGIGQEPCHLINMLNLLNILIQGKKS